MTIADGFSDEQKQAVYDAIHLRRDMRHFLPDPIDEAIIVKLLQAAHAAPSVGFMQPWRVIRIKSPDQRQRLHALVEAERICTAQAMGDRQEAFMQLKVEGIVECAEVWVVSLMENREQHVFGRRTMPSMDLASASCAIQNVWLAARAEGIGVGWVSIFEPQSLKALLGIPAEAEPVAILCLGHVQAFYPEPMLQQQGWAQRGCLDDYVMNSRWDSEKAMRAQQQWNQSE